MEVKEQEGISLGELFHVIFNRKWLIIIITAVVAVLGTLGVKLVYDANAEYYEAVFTVEYPGYDTGNYPDGTSFDYRDFVSYNNLKNTVEGNSNLTGVDVDDMYEKNNITIEELYKVINNYPYKTGEYRLVVSQKYFKDKNQAKEFLSGLVGQPIQTVLSIIKNMNYKSNLTSYSSAVAYNTQIDYLVAQKELIISGYESLIELYNEAFVIDGKLLRDYLSEITVYFNNNKINTLYTELETEGYVKDLDSYIDTVNLEIKALEIEKEDNDKTVKNLKTELKELVDLYGSSATIQTYESFNQKIAELTARNVEIERELKILNGYLDTTNVKDTKAFDEKLNMYYEDLLEFTDTYVNAVNAVYKENSKIIHNYNSIVKGDGGIGTIIGFAGSCIIGAVLACVFVLVMDLPKYLRNKKKENTQVEEVK